MKMRLSKSSLCIVLAISLIFSPLTSANHSYAAQPGKITICHSGSGSSWTAITIDSGAWYSNGHIDHIYDYVDGVNSGAALCTGGRTDTSPPQIVSIKYFDPANYGPTAPELTGPFKNGTPLRIQVVFTDNVGIKFNSVYLEISGARNLSSTLMTLDANDNTGFTFYYDYTVPSGSDGTATVSITGQDPAGNSVVPGPTTTKPLVIDNTAPTLSPVHIQSNNAVTSKAKVGDTVTLTFTSSETINTPTVTIAGHTVSATNSGNDWTATYVMVSGDTEGIVQFSISFSDLALNAGTTVSSTTDGSLVTFDKAAPTSSASPAGGTYNTDQLVTLSSTDGSATIYYTTDETDPTTSGTRQIYSETISITTNTTLKFYAVDAAGNAESPFNSVLYTIDKTIPDTKPDEITDLQADAVSGTQITLTWSKPSDGGSEIKSYTIKRGTDGSTFDTIVSTTISGSDTSYLDNGLSINTKYYYQIYAVNEIGTSDSSNTAYDTTWNVPSVPLSLTGKATSSTQIALDWKAPEDDGGSPVTDYIIKYKLDDGVNWNTFAHPRSTVTNIKITGVDNAKPYQFKVAAKNSVGVGPYTGDLAADALDTKTKPPKILTIIPSANQIELSWSPPYSPKDPVKSYEINYWKSGDDETLTKKESSTKRTTILEDLSTDTKYEMTVNAITTKTSLVSSPASVTTSANRLTPTLSGTLTVSDKGVYFCWDKPEDDFSSFIVTYTSESDSTPLSATYPDPFETPYSLPGTSIVFTSIDGGPDSDQFCYKNTGLTPDETYHFTVEYTGKETTKIAELDFTTKSPEIKNMVIVPGDQSARLLFEVTKNAGYITNTLVEERNPVNPEEWSDITDTEIGASLDTTKNTGSLREIMISKNTNDIHVYRVTLTNALESFPSNIVVVIPSLKTSEKLSSDDFVLIQPPEKPAIITSDEDTSKDITDVLDQQPPSPAIVTATKLNPFDKAFNQNLKFEKSSVSKDTSLDDLLTQFQIAQYQQPEMWYSDKVFAVPPAIIPIKDDDTTGQLALYKLDGIPQNNPVLMAFNDASPIDGNKKIAGIQFTPSEDVGNIEMAAKFLDTRPTDGKLVPPSTTVVMYIDIKINSSTDFSNKDSFSESPKIYFNVGPVEGNAHPEIPQNIVNDKITCPEVYVFYNGDEANPVDTSDIITYRDPRGDDETSCGYVATVPHFSPFGVGLGSGSGGAGGSVGGADSADYPPTIGMDENGYRRLVNNGITFNGYSSNVNYYYTPFPLEKAQIGTKNVLELKIRENTGPQNIFHIGLSLGIPKGKIFNDGMTKIFWDKSFSSTHESVFNAQDNSTVTVQDPRNILQDVSVKVSEDLDYCRPADVGPECMVIKFYFTFREAPKSEMFGTDIWDNHRNSWQNYFNHGIHVVGVSMNPEEMVDGIYKGHIYHLNQTSDNSAVDEFGNNWTLLGTEWIKDYVKPIKEDLGIYNNEKLSALSRVNSNQEQCKTITTNGKTEIPSNSFCKYFAGSVEEKAATFSYDRLNNKFAQQIKYEQFIALSKLDQMELVKIKQNSENVLSKCYKMDNAVSFCLDDDQMSQVPKERIPKLQDPKIIKSMKQEANKAAKKIADMNIVRTSEPKPYSIKDDDKNKKISSKSKLQSPIEREMRKATILRDRT